MHGVVGRRRRGAECPQVSHVGVGGAPLRPGRKEGRPPRDAGGAHHARDVRCRPTGAAQGFHGVRLRLDGVAARRRASAMVSAIHTDRIGSARSMRNHGVSGEYDMMRAGTPSVLYLCAPQCRHTRVSSSHREKAMHPLGQHSMGHDARGTPTKSSTAHRNCSLETDTPFTPSRPRSATSARARTRAATRYSSSSLLSSPVPSSVPARDPSSVPSLAPSSVPSLSPSSISSPAPSSVLSPPPSSVSSHTPSPPSSYGSSHTQSPPPLAVLSPTPPPISWPVSSPIRSPVRSPSPSPSPSPASTSIPRSIAPLGGFAAAPAAEAPATPPVEPAVEAVARAAPHAAPVPTTPAARRAAPPAAPRAALPAQPRPAPRTLLTAAPPAVPEAAPPAVLAVAPSEAALATSPVYPAVPPPACAVLPTSPRAEDRVAPLDEWAVTPAAATVGAVTPAAVAGSDVPKTASARGIARKLSDTQPWASTHCWTSIGHSRSARARMGKGGSRTAGRYEGGAAAYCGKRAPSRSQGNRK
ncbi:hypothetical protein BU14_0200s0008, partial [Porphyra umbilicalis]